MATEKVTPMVLKVDLQCHCCYKKIKRTLCKFPQIRDQIYDEKNNTVSIIVVCCSPEKIRDKLCSKAGKVIKGIEIKDAAKPKEPEKKKESDKSKDQPKPKDTDKPKDANKPKVVIADYPKDPEKPKKVTVIENPEKPKSKGKADKPPKSDGGPPPEKPKDAPKMEPAKISEPAAKPPVAASKGPEPVPVNGIPSVFPYMGPSYDAHGSGPYYHGYGFPPPPQPCYEGHYVYGPGSGYGPEYGYGYGRVGQASRCDGYFSEENPQGCFIM